MSLTDSPDCLFRAEDKALKMLFPTPEEPVHNSFDEFFNKELYDLHNEADKQEYLLQDTVFAPERTQNMSPIHISMMPQQASPQPWRKGLWCLNSKPKSDLFIGKTRKLGQIAQKFITPTYLSRNDNAANHSPTPASRTKTRAYVADPGAASLHNAEVERDVGIHEQGASPQETYAQSALNDNTVHGDSWQQDFQNFHLQMPDRSTYLSSDSVQKPPVRATALRQANARNTARNATIAVPRQSPAKYHYPFNYMSRPDAERSSGPSPDMSGLDVPGARLEQLYHATYSSAGADQYRLPVWTTESLYSSDSSHQSQGSQLSSEHSRGLYNGCSSHNWVSSPPLTSTIFASHDNQASLAAPIPQRVPHQVLHHQNHHGGLGIQYQTTNEIGRAVSYTAKSSYNAGYRPVTPSYETTSNASLPYPPLPPYPSHIFTEDSPFTTPRRNNNKHSTSLSPSCSPSPSISPSRRSPSRSDQPGTRRKSIHKPGPIKTKDKDQNKDPVNPSPRHRNTSRTRSRTRSSSRPAPRTPNSASFGQIDFVNFTPKDSAKLMADVAPSGSSKTRARRELEAREKRKKLSEAALQAVRNAGGDVAALEEAIFV